MFIDRAITLAQSNPVLAAGVMAMLTGSALYLLRAAPVLLFRAIVRAMTVELAVSSDDEVFDWVNEWLASHGYSRKARLLKLSTGKANDSEWSLAPGFGTHVFWDSGLVILSRHLQEDKGGNFYGRPREKFILRTIGRGQSTIRALIERANQKRAEENALRIRVWSGSWWVTVPSKAKRDLDSVILPADQKREIIDHAEWFFSSKDWFAERGVPYRQGCLFHGPPGTGKTSLAMALAGHFSKPLYMINLATLPDDNSLMSAFLNTSKSCVVVIEDVDAAKASAARPSEGDGKDGAPSTPPTGISLSGLLNAIDGIASSDGRLLIMTTNHVDALDPALIREGRVDRRFEVGPLAPTQVYEMAARFLPENPAAWEEARARAERDQPRPAAYWQTALMAMSRACLPPPSSYGLALCLPTPQPETRLPRPTAPPPGLLSPSQATTAS